MANGLLDLRMSPGIEAYNADSLGYSVPTGNMGDVQAYYKVMQILNSLPPNQRPTTDAEIQQFINAYTQATQDYSGYIPQPQNVGKYLNANVNGVTDDEIYKQLLMQVGPGLLTR